MLDNKFCWFLELEISNALASSKDDNLKGFWCDGVLLPTFENDYSKKFVNDSRQITMTAFIGLTGQDQYELILRFGPTALSKYARDLDISECIPKDKTDEWFYIDLKEKTVIIQTD
ncbi:hypothetical protein [Pinibacter soli]|uniref:Uncharacterized protein n=1 Tax=Pinibacter soli TaxID=3044211 RepID=A0ABT6RE29_9BACT|nr:hypothetical protein [Pinibacter soli]MDI3320785.1 hypothetical protein [Pinibacter soli]